MKTFVVISVIFFISVCYNDKKPLNLSEFIQIETTAESFDHDYKNLCLLVPDIEKHLIWQKIYIKFPDANKDFIQKAYLRSVKESVNKSIRIANTVKRTTTNFLKVEIGMEYDPSKVKEAKEIIKYYRELVIEALENKGVAVSKE